MVKKGCDEKRHGPKGSVSGGNLLWGRMMRQNMSRKRQNETVENGGRRRRNPPNEISSRNFLFFLSFSLSPPPLFKIRLSSSSSRGGIKLDRKGGGS